ncbi:MAG TPA: fused MFS/spermidine synthase, partial [Acidobacteriota bacterium]|nr:fused MFS/spermidine synthase [Acidobacteriota bacterium]
MSGLTSLVYEIVWTRILSTIIGNSSLAVALVVCIFMAGLAIGSFFSARWSRHNRNPLYSYAILELLIGAYSLATPYIAPWVENIYAAGYASVATNFFLSVLLKSFLTTLFLLLPTIAMGATLPILIRAFTQEERRQKAALLYGANTAGAVAGTLLAGYFLLPEFGIATTIQLTACLNALIALIAFLMGGNRMEAAAHSQITAPFQPLYLLPFFTG